MSAQTAEPGEAMLQGVEYAEDEGAASVDL